jgi:cellulose biosynthesis protein BcsQ
LKAVTVAVINQKGGVGKTTLTFNLAACLAEDHNKRVLTVDLDPHFSLTQYMIPKTQYNNDVSLWESIIINT